MPNHPEKSRPPCPICNQPIGPLELTQSVNPWLNGTHGPDMEAHAACCQMAEAMHSVEQAQGVFNPPKDPPKWITAILS